MELKVIAYARNGHTDKFGIPRQSREESPILTRIVFEPEFSVPEALRGIEGYSHLWLIWGFSAARPASPERPSQDDCKTANAVRPQAEPAVGQSWSPTVRPPRLGGNKRMGVFATRSPFRPNGIGLTSVKLIEVAYPRPLPKGKGDNRLELLVSGADVMDGTPIYDIKPYLSFSDSHPDAQNGFAEEHKNDRLEVDWGLISRKCLDNGSILPREWLDDVEEKWVRDVEYILSQDPRPAYQDDPEREYKLDYDGYTVSFCVNKQTIVVKKIEKTQK